MWSFRLEAQHTRRHSLAVRALVFALVILATSLLNAQAPATPAAAHPTSPRVFFDTYCIACHNQKLHTAGLALDTLDAAQPNANAEVWERVIGKLRAGSMPPPGRPRADAATYRTIAGTLENEIDKAWIARPNPGKVGAVHRLNRAEYNHAIRDLFALDLDVKPLLPAMRPPTAASTTSRMCSRFRRPTSNATCRWRAKSRGWRRDFLPPVLGSSGSRSPCT